MFNPIKYIKDRPGLLDSVVFLFIFTVIHYYGPAICRILWLGPPGVHLKNVVYNTKTSYVTGNIAGTKNPDQYGVIVSIAPNANKEYSPRPSEDKAVQPVAKEDGSFRVQAYNANEPRDRLAQFYCVLIVPSDFDYRALAADPKKAVWDLAREEASYVWCDKPTNNKK